MGPPPTIPTAANSEVSSSVEPSVPSQQMLPAPCPGGSCTDLSFCGAHKLLPSLWPQTRQRRELLVAWTIEETESRIWCRIHSSNIRQPAMCQVPGLPSGFQSWLERSPGLGSSELLLHPPHLVHVQSQASPSRWGREHAQHLCPGRVDTGKTQPLGISVSVWASSLVLRVGLLFPLCL